MRQKEAASNFRFDEGIAQAVLVCADSGRESVDFFGGELRGLQVKGVAALRGAGVYCISADKYKEWQPPMVPEPSTYGAGLMGMGLAVTGYRFRFRRRPIRLSGAGVAAN